MYSVKFEVTRITVERCFVRAKNKREAIDMAMLYDFNPVSSDLVFKARKVR